MQWICNIALFLVFSGIVLELIADTKYYKFARWVAGVLLLLQFFKPLTEIGDRKEWFAAMFGSFDYALGTDRILDEIYETEEQTEQSVLKQYKDSICRQVDTLLQKNGLRLVQAEISVTKDGRIEELFVQAEYLDGTEQGDVRIPTVSPVRVGEKKEKKTVSPFELYVRETLAAFYQIEESCVEVELQEAG